MYPFLLNTTNILKQPKSVFAAANKAAPTVQISLSNVNAQRDAMPANTEAHSSIPFPAHPIQCTRVSPAHNEDQFEDIVLTDAWEVVPLPQDSWQKQAPRKHVRSYSTTPYITLHGHTSPCPDVDMHGPPPISSLPSPRKRKIAVRKPYASASPKPPKRTRRSKSAKKQLADLEFTATLHRSILSQLRNIAFSSPALSASPFAVSDSRDDDLLHLQDQKLVERLWSILVEQRAASAASDARQTCPSNAFVSDADLFALRPGSIDHIFVSEPIYDHKSTSTGLPTQPPSPTFGPPHLPRAATAPVIIPSARSRDLSRCSSKPTPPLPPTTRSIFINSPTPTSPDAQILAIPQLVASLILRHRDRSATRPRSNSSRPASGISRPSPLSSCVSIPPPSTGRSAYA